MFEPTYYLPSIETMEKSLAGLSVIERKRSKSLDDLLGFGSMIVYVKDRDNKRTLSERESLWKDYFGNLKRSYKGKDERVWFNRNAEILKCVWEEEMKQEDASIWGFGGFDFVRDTVKKGCLCHVCETSSKEDCETLFLTAKSVAQLIMYGLSYVDMSVFEDRLTSEKYDIVSHTLFFAVARFVLSIFDMEDFKRIHKREEVSQLVNLNRDSHGALVKGEAKYDNDPHRVGVSHAQIYMAMEVIVKYSPMKEYYKRELSFELVHKTCFHVFDTLVMKVLRNIALDSLFGSVAHKEENQRGKYMDDVKEVEFKHFVEGLIKGLLGLGAMKSVLEGLDGQASDESRVDAESPKVWRNPVWKDEEIFSLFKLGWTPSGEVELLCPGKEFIGLLSQYSKIAPPMFRPRCFW